MGRVLQLDFEINYFAALSVGGKSGLEEYRVMTNCDECVNYVYDEDYDCYTCLVNLDEDEMYRFLQGTNYDCPYYDKDDEYFLAGKQ